MKPIERGEVLGLADYETIREHFRKRVMELKKYRRVKLGDKASALFENRDTVLLQIQEMIRTERITKESAIKHEIETYNDLIPGPDELSATVMIEITDDKERREFLRAATGFESHVALVVGSERAIGRAKSPAPEGPTSAVHYLKFKLSPRAAGSLRAGASSNSTITHVELVVDHPAYKVNSTLPVEAIVALGEDLAGS